MLTIYYEVRRKMIRFASAKSKLRVVVAAAVSSVAIISVGCYAEYKSIVPSTTYVPSEWFNFYTAYKTANEWPWDSPDLDLKLEEFPEDVFCWAPTTLDVTVTDKNGTKSVFYQLCPKWNVFLADLNGDGLPELCATISAGFGVTSENIAVYDYSGDNVYALWALDAGGDLSLSLEKGRLIATLSHARVGGVISVGELAIIDGELVIVNIRNST